MALRFLRSSVIAMTIALATGGPAFAAPGSGGRTGVLGLLGGVTFPTTASGTFTFGASALYRLKARLAVGAFLLSWGASVEAVTDSGEGVASTSSTSYGAELGYVLESGVRLGARVGLMNMSSEFTASGGSDEVAFSDGVTSFFVMPVFGYDHRIGSMFSIGAEVGYGLAFSSQAPNLFSFAITPKIWF